jgi:spore coat protein U-like protein
MVRVSLLAASALLLGLCGSASAGTVSGTPFTVQVNVVAGCVITTDVAGPIDFGSAAPSDPTPADVPSQVGVNCTNTAPYKIRFTSVNPVTGNTDRQMTFGADSVGYQIRAGATLIGNTNATGLGGTGTGAIQTTNLNFHINAWTPAALGVYTDTVTLQVDF